MTRKSRNVLVITAICVVVAAVTAFVSQRIERQSEIPDSVGRAHAVAFRGRQTGQPLAPGQPLIELHGTPGQSPDAPPLLSVASLRTRACRVDAIIVARITGRQSYLTDESSFVYSVHVADVLRVLKASDTVGPTAETVTFSRPGGVVPSEQGARQVRLHEFPALQIGRQYMIGLVAKDGVLVADDRTMAFQVINDDAFIYGEINPDARIGLPITELEARIIEATATPCQQSEAQR